MAPTPTDNGVDAVRLIAFYLPQFHPIPENDDWWGRGFTEWTNVTRARPRFVGHYQPHLPADLGFYDLRLPETREAQAALAREYGIGGFCYYHYWFNGRRVLERPFNEVLASGRPDFPFCLCWANENWTRAWDGFDRRVLLGQDYNEEDDLAHIRSLVPALSDSRYIRFRGRPLLLVYRANRLPEPRRTAERWRDEARKAGLGELFLARVESFPDEQGDPAVIGFDGAVEFPPASARYRTTPIGRKVRRAAAQYGLPLVGLARRHLLLRDYWEDAALPLLERPDPPYFRFRGVMPSWDNSARRKRHPTIFVRSTPRKYEQWLTEVVRRASEAGGEQLVFVNAWNEWAEGNHLEPDQRWGHAYLEATRAAIDGSRAAR